MTTYTKIVKGATKLKVAAPKSKYLEPILMATSMNHSSSSENFNTIMTTLNERLQDSSWSVVYKTLLVIHIMIREGDLDVTLSYLAERAPNMLNLSRSNISKHSAGSPDVRYIMKYSRYLHTRVKHFADTKIDYVRDERVNNTVTQTGGRLRTLSVEKGLLRECESVQKQIDALLKNSFMEAEIKNEIILTAFRLLVNDLLALFQELNEGVINLLEHYFEMFHNDAERALEVYKKFVDQTKYVIDYLRVAKHLEYITKLHVPSIKHAPTALTSSLEEYLNDPLFEQHRADYLIHKKEKKSTDTGKSFKMSEVRAAPANSQPPVPGPDANLPSTQEANGGFSGTQSTLQRNNTLMVSQSTFNPWSNSLAQATYPNPVLTAPIPTGNAFNEFGVSAVNQMQSQQSLQQQQQLQQQQLQQQQLQQQQLQQQQFQMQVPQQTGGNPFTSTGTQPLVQGYTGFQQFNNPSNMQVANTTGLHQNGKIGLSRANTNPFSSMTKAGNTTSVDSTNPFGQTRFNNANTTAFSFGNGTTPVSSTSTGINPFKVSDATKRVFSSAGGNKIEERPIIPQPTAGGLEKLPTVAVFPETQREQNHNAYLDAARANLNYQATGQLQQHIQVAPQAQQWPQSYPQPQQQQSYWSQAQHSAQYNEPSLI